MEVDGEIVKEPVDIKREILSFYQKPYTVTEEWRPGFNMSNNPRIEEAEMLRLQRPFEEEEVFQIIKQCALDKAPEPDGYTMGVFIIKEDIMSTIQNFHRGECFKKNLQCYLCGLDSKEEWSKGAE